MEKQAPTSASAHTLQCLIVDMIIMTERRPNIYLFMHVFLLRTFPSVSRPFLLYAPNRQTRDESEDSHCLLVYRSFVPR